MKERTYKFYGVCGNFYKLDGTVWEAKEDESDGYRSYLGSIELKSEKEISELIFFPEPIATVTIKEIEDKENNRNGYQFLDIKDNHEWLFVGTGNFNDYYPYFLFQYQAKAPKKSWDEFLKEGK